jgi:hypothetical protein
MGTAALRRADVDGRAAIAELAVTDLTERVVAPALETARLHHRAGVVVSGLDTGHVPIEPGHRRRRVALIERSVAKFSICVPTPAEHSAVAQRAGELTSHRDGVDGLRQALDRNWDGATVGASVAELAMGVRTPAEHTTVRKSTDVVVAGVHLENSLAPGLAANQKQQEQRGE